MNVDKVLLEVLEPYLQHKDSRISDDSLLAEDLGLDSLDYVDMIMSLEEKYALEFAEEDITDFRTFGDLKKALEEKLFREGVTV